MSINKIRMKYDNQWLFILLMLILTKQLHIVLFGWTVPDIVVKIETIICALGVIASRCKMLENEVKMIEDDGDA